MLQWTEVSDSCTNLSVAATCERTDSASPPTCLQLMGGVESQESTASIAETSPAPGSRAPGSWGRVT
jgi:hypothetical protein